VDKLNERIRAFNDGVGLLRTKDVKPTVGMDPALADYDKKIIDIDKRLTQEIPKDWEAIRQMKELILEHDENLTTLVHALHARRMKASDTSAIARTDGDVNEAKHTEGEHTASSQRRSADASSTELKLPPIRETTTINKLPTTDITTTTDTSEYRELLINESGGHGSFSYAPQDGDSDSDKPRYAPPPKDCDIMDSYHSSGSSDEDEYSCGYRSKTQRWNGGQELL
jgi:hypothetical protein